MPVKCYTMSGMKDLVSGDCGGAAPLVAAAGRVRRGQADRARWQQGQGHGPQQHHDPLAQEFLAQQRQREGSQRFRMDHLLREVDAGKATGARPKQQQQGRN